MVHAHGDAGPREVEDVVGGGLAAVSRLDGHGQLAGAGHLEVGGAVLVAVGVAAEHDRLRPARPQARHVLDDDGLSAAGAAHAVAAGAVRRGPTLLPAVLPDPGLGG